MVNSNDPNVTSVVGTTGDDHLGQGYVDPNEGTVGDDNGGVDKINGNAGSDEIGTGGGDDLLAGDMVGEEWSFINGKWVYDPDAINTTGAPLNSYDDTLYGGDGNDVLLGNGGHDEIYGGAGNDLVNAGSGNDDAYGGDGNDILNLEDGDDLGVGGAGNDIINAGDGEDLVYGDGQGDNLLNTNADGSNPTSFDQYAASGGWNIETIEGQTSMSQNVDTEEGGTYTIQFDLAANLAGGLTSGTVEVMWNGEVVGTITAESGVYETHSIDVVGDGSEGVLTFNTVSGQDESGVVINMDGPIFSYEKTMEIDGQEIDVAAFAPGQAKLYQVIDGQLKVFDPETKNYEDAGDPTGIKINAIGFNVEDDMIYGIAKKDGFDHLGNPVSKQDLVMMDAEGNAYCIGETGHGDYVGDFDSEGNLWTFDSSLNRVSAIDVDNLDANGNPVVTDYNLPNNLFEGRAYDIAYNAEENAFYAVEAPGENGGNGTVHKIDISGLADGGQPVITSIPITGTLYDDEMSAGMSKGAYGAVFLDGDGNLYYGLNKGDHDLDGSTGADGGIFKVNLDWDNGSAFAEFVSEAPATGSNDGAVDPRSSDAFAEVDDTAPFLIRDPIFSSTEGGNDILRGGEGNDEIYGGAGDDKVIGGADNDELFGDEGSDQIRGGTGNDEIYGGLGDDKILGGSGGDTAFGGEGNDYINAGGGHDNISGGAGNDKLVGGKGADTINGGEGDDHMWGGNWEGDNENDTFVISTASGKDMIHDFEIDHDQIDLSSFGLEFADLKPLMSDVGWATEIDLSGLTGGSAGDKLILKSVDLDELDESNFIF